MYKQNIIKYKTKELLRIHYYRLDVLKDFLAVFKIYTEDYVSDTTEIESLFVIMHEYFLSTKSEFYKGIKNFIE